MIVNYYSVFDKKSGIYSPVFPCPTHGAAERMVRDTATQEGNQLGRYPDDFALYHVFTFDDNHGLIVTKHEPVLLIVEVQALIS